MTTTISTLGSLSNPTGQSSILCSNGSSYRPFPTITVDTSTSSKFRLLTDQPVGGFIEVLRDAT